MGNFYTNITVLDGAALTRQLRRLAREAFVADLGGTCVVYDRECEQQDTGILGAVAARLSLDLDARSFVVLNHDDDILWFQLYDHSGLIAEYANRGGAPNERAGVVPNSRTARSGTVGVAPAPQAVCLPVSRHQLLARRLGLPRASVGSGFDYISRGESPAGVNADQLVRVRGS